MERSRGQAPEVSAPHQTSHPETEGGIPKAVTPMGFLTNSFCQQNKTNKTHKDSETSPRLKFLVCCVFFTLTENILTKLTNRGLEESVLS